MSLEQSHRSDILVYDAKAGGHRENCVNLFAGLTGGAPLIAPPRKVWRRLIAARHLVLTTYETKPGAFLPILAARALLGRRSAVIFMRAHLRRARAFSRFMHRAAIALINRSRGILPLTLVALPDEFGGDRFVTIADPEFWDLDRDDIEAETPLSKQALDFAEGRAILLVTGYIEADRGLAFLHDIYDREDGLVRTLVPVLGGTVAADAKAAASGLAALGALVIDRYLSDQEMMSLYGAATAAWCCYVPERDMSSGIFGRAIQFGVAPIVRRGSVLHRFSADIDNAAALDFGDIEEAGRRLSEGFSRSAPRLEGSSETRDAMRALLIGHFEAAARAA